MADIDGQHVHYTHRCRLSTIAALTILTEQVYSTSAQNRLTGASCFGTTSPGERGRRNVVIEGVQKFEATFSVKRRIIPCGTRAHLSCGLEKDSSGNGGARGQNRDK